MEGASALKSTTDDLLKFLAAFTGLKKTALSSAMASMFQTTRPGQGFVQAIGWWIIPFGEKDDRIFALGGETFGYTCSIAYDPVSKIGVVVLSNSEVTDGGLAWHIMRVSWPVETSKSKQAQLKYKEITIDFKLLELFAGKYQPEAPGGVITIERDGNILVMKSSTTPPDGLKLYAESNDLFFIKEADLQITFQSDHLNKATGLILHFGGIDYPAKRTE